MVMKVSLHEIDEKPTQIQFQIARNDLHKIDQRFEFPNLSCKATLSRSQEFILLKGQYQVSLASSCDRCLQTTETYLEEEFELDLVQESNQNDPDGDVEISLDSPNLDYYEGEEIHLNDYFEDQVVLDLPIMVLCSEECKGLCSNCGIDLNKETCTCQEKTGNNPFAVLKDLEPDRQ